MLIILNLGKEVIHMTEKQQELFESKSVWNAIFTMAVPAMVTMVVMILYNMADMYFVGRTGDTVQVAAVSLVGPVFSIMMAIGSMLGGGACALIAKTLGEKNTEEVHLYSSLCCWGGICFGVIFGGVVLLLREPLLTFLGSNAEMRPYASVYLTVLAMGAPIMIFASAGGNILRAEGAVKQSMFSSLLSTVTNIILDPIFILVLKLGVGGAAIATVIGNALAAVYLIIYFRKGKSSLRVHPKFAMQKPWKIMKIVAIGLPNLVSSTLVGFAGAFANQLLVQYGTIAVAAMAAAGKSTMMISMLQMGLTMGIQPLMAYSYGAEDLDRLKEIIKKIAILTIGIGLVVSVTCFVGSKTAISLFLKDPQALELGQKMIRLLVLSGPFLGLYYICSNFLQASGNAKVATFTSLLRQGIFLILLLYIMNYFFGVTGNICAHLTADITASLLAGALAIRQYRKLKSEIGVREPLNGKETARKQILN